VIRLLLISLLPVAALVAATGASADTRTLTLAPSAQTIVYGSALVLSGRTAGGLANQAVALTSQPTAGKGAQSLMSTLTGTNGSFAFDVSPTISTSYRAQWGAGSSSGVTVNVAPRVSLTRAGELLELR